MKNIKLKKVMTSLLLIVSVLALNPMRASAEWKQDNIGWWFTEGSSWLVGWKEIDGKWYYFGQDGYMKIGWLQDINGKWYYLNSDGSMAHDTTIDGYTIDSEGVWSQIIQNSSQTLVNDNSNFSIDELVSILKTKFSNVVAKDVEKDFLPTTRKLITINDERLTIYVYSSNEEMEKDAANLIKNNGSYVKTLANGQVEGISYDWSYAPHFYKKGKIIVQYCGENATILSDLKVILGEAFEGETKINN